MATPTTAATTEPATPSFGSDDPVELRPLDWWADLEFGRHPIDSPRMAPPIPAFVRLSRLIDPELMMAARSASEPGKATDNDIDNLNDASLDALLDDSADDGVDASVDATVDEAAESRARSWAESAGRPLFQVGLAAIVAATVVGVSTFGADTAEVSTVEGSAPSTSIVPGSAPVGGADDEQARRVLESLVRQGGGDGESDMTLVGTASATGNEIRWTATIRNEGPDAAEGPIMVVHTIGAPFELVSVAGTGWDCDHKRAAGTIACELDEDLLVGRRHRLGLVVASDSSVPGSTIASTMSVVAANTDPNLDNNTINVTAIGGPANESDRGTDEEAQSRSTGAATDDATTAGGADDAAASGAGSAGMEELPRTGSGLALVLGGIGAGFCAAGRRLTTWSSRAQTRTLLAAAKIS